LNQQNNISENDNYAKRGRSDFFSTNLKVALHNCNASSPLRDRYLYSTFCNKTLTKKDNKITGKYCGQRWCVTCNRIRTGELIDSYLPEIQNIEDPRFITLTLKNCKADELRTRVQWMIKAWSRIQKKLRRKKGVKGYRKLEVTHNQRFNDFHPHFHAIINGQENGNFIISEWLKECQDANIEAVSDFQDNKAADINSMKELFKYTTKILPKKPKGKNWQQVFHNQKAVYKFLKGQDEIYTALVRVRCFQPFGFKPIKETKEEEALKVQAQTTNLDIPDGKYHRTKSGNWMHELYDTTIHNKPLSEHIVKLISLMGGQYIRI
jgi:hypothetical protein